MTGPSLRQSTGADGRGRDYLRDLYLEQFATHPEYRPARPPLGLEDYPAVTEQEALRHRREAVAEYYGWAELYRHNNDEGAA